MENRESVVRKLTVYVATAFSGDWKKAFDSYATNGLISTSALDAIFVAAGIGTMLGRPFIESMVFNLFDANGNRSISWDQFQSIAHTTPPAPPKP